VKERSSVTIKSTDVTHTRAARRIYGQADPRDLPAYRIPEVAHFLWMPGNKLSRWASGYTHDGRREAPLIKVADPVNGALSFNNLAELHVLSSLRYHAVPLQRVRKAISYLRREVLGDDHPHPLLALEMRTDGLDVFTEHLGGGLVNLSGHGQFAIREVFEAHLQRIERDPNRGPIRLFPFAKPFTTPDEARAQSRPVTIDPVVSFGRPVLTSTRVPTLELANRFSAGEPIASLAEDLDLDPEAIEDALRYELATRAA
jgi:uncharacterized protein (DUF433 family)